MQRQLKEFDRLRESEKKAHGDILKLHEVLRKIRIMSRFKEVLLR